MKYAILFTFFTIVFSAKAQTTITPSADTTVAYAVTIQTPAVVHVDYAFDRSIQDRMVSIVAGYYCSFGVRDKDIKRITTSAESGALFTKNNTLCMAAAEVTLPVGKGFEVGLRGTFAKGFSVPTAIISYNRSVYPKVMFSAFVGPGAAFFSRNQSNIIVGRNGNVTEQRTTAFAVDGGARVSYSIYKSLAVSLGGGALFYSGNNTLPYVTAGVELRPVVKRTKQSISYCQYRESRN